MRQQPNLPIFALEQQIKARLPKQHLVVEAATGSGKSTTLPLWAAETGRVLVVQPRRIACEALAGYVATLTDKKVGHAIRFFSDVDERTDIAFVTPGIALRWLSENQLRDFDTLILDEFHERRWDTDLLLALCRDSHLRLLVTSATLNAQALQHYLSAEQLCAEGRQFEVSLHYAARESHHLPDGRNLAERCAEQVRANLEATAGDVLVFLPGRGEINSCAQQLSQLDCPVLPLHSTISDSERQRILKPSPQQRVILATNVAETSLTIPGVTLVIDSGLERRTEQRNGRTVLSLKRISQASAQQRRGRAGRTAPGHCIRLWGEFAPLEAQTPPQLQREELLEPLLHAAAVGKQLSELDFIEALPSKALGIAGERALQMGATDENGKLSAHGSRLLKVGIDSFFSHLISLMPDTHTREAMVDIGAALSTPQRLYSPPSELDWEKVFNQWLPSYCEATAIIQLMRTAEEHWPQELEVNRDALRQARELAAQLRQSLGLAKLNKASTYQRNALISALLTHAPELAFVRRERRRNAMGNGQLEIQIARDSIIPELCEAAIVLDYFSLPGKGSKQLNTLGLCMMPLRLDDLMRHQLGETEAIDGSLSEGGAQVIRRYAGREIGHEQQALSPDALCQQLSREILANRLFKGLGASLRDDIGAWNLWVQLGEKHGGGEGEPVDAEQWLYQQLSALGCESHADVELLDADDFAFAGIPDWQREGFDEAYPRSLVLAELKLDVEYLPLRRQVVVHYRSGLRKDGPKRWELPRWNGWKIIYQKASKRVTLN
ncbi:helicase-related protein [Aliagarivorans taiwanensis]|uniref:helicase-related protein n=1 Tax=Aliagarivorans taiwanensis TaxID=561966 RepID=UPI00040BDFB6|nr:helicase-related protein [Aliagarivorans taiwanensis]